jgi:hypothetical protein
MRRSAGTRTRCGRIAVLVDLRHLGRLDPPVFLVVLHDAERVGPEISDLEFANNCNRALVCFRNALHGIFVLRYSSVVDVARGRISPQQ